MQQNVNSSENYLTSPLSAFEALGVLSQGAEGKTFEELVNGLDVSKNKAVVANQFQEFNKELNKSAGTMEFRAANRVYVSQKYKLNETFQQTVQRNFDAGIQSLNFANATQSADTINHFVESETNGKIQNLISPGSLGADTVSVIVNAIYMRGQWMRKFDKKKTKSGLFFSTKTKKTVDYMNQVADFNYSELPDLNATALKMLYVNSSFSFVIVLPKPDVQLADVENKLKTYDWSRITEQMHVHKVNVTMPKFKNEFTQNLNTILKNVRTIKYAILAKFQLDI